MHHSRGSFEFILYLLITKRGRDVEEILEWDCINQGEDKIVSFMVRFNYLNFSTSSREVRTRFVIVLLPSNRGRLLGIIFIDLMIQNKKNET